MWPCQNSFCHQIQNYPCSFWKLNILNIWYVFHVRLCKIYGFIEFAYHCTMFLFTFYTVSEPFWNWGCSSDVFHLHWSCLFIPQNVSQAALHLWSTLVLFFTLFHLTPVAQLKQGRSSSTKVELIKNCIRQTVAKKVLKRSPGDQQHFLKSAPVFILMLWFLRVVSICIYILTLVDFYIVLIA